MIRAALFVSLIGWTPALAEDPEKLAREVRSGWVVMPATPDERVITVQKGDFVLRQRLLPVGYATLDADLIANAGDKVLTPKGTPLMRLIGSNGSVFCIVRPPRRLSPGAAFWRGFTGGDLRFCFRDSDKDGKLDELVGYRGLVDGLPSLNGRLPKTLHPLKNAVAYTEHDPTTMPAQFFLGIRYLGHAPLTGVPLFIDAFGQEDDVGTLDRAWPRGDSGNGKLTATGKVLLKGAELDVVADGDDAIKVKIDRGFPEGVFTIVQHGHNGFY